MTTPTSPRLLTKSRFQLAAGCPTRLYYHGRPDTYANAQDDDHFLRALADGGIQVGELAKLMFPGGVEITARGYNEQAEETRALLATGEVTIFEAAIRHDDYFVRVDILRRSGRELHLIEVKAKSFDSSDPHAFRGKRGGLVSGMLPYLRDVAFQTLVLRAAHPGYTVRPFLMLMDKQARCSVDGLHQRFRVRRDGRQVWVETLPDTAGESIGEPLLAEVDVGEYVEEVLEQVLEVPGAVGRLDELARQWAEAHREDRRITPVIGKHCADCQFRTSPTGDGLRSGFHECWNEAGLSDDEIRSGTVLSLWNHRGKQTFIERGVLRLRDVPLEELNGGVVSDPLSRADRQAMQVSGSWPGGGRFYLNRTRMREAMRSWTYPLQCIDFEATRTAIPFHAGDRPYGLIAFQFSVHSIAPDGAVTHQAEFLGTEPGRNPNYDFLRALQAALDPRGTTFMWSPYEKSVLGEIRRELQEDPASPDDARTLVAFIERLTGASAGGEGAMVDLCRLAEHAFFHPDSGGSSSIKKVLPAVLRESAFLRERYSRPVYGARGGTPSRNFTDFTWWQDAGDGTPRDPYSLLPPVFRDIPLEQVLALELDEFGPLAEGGAAMVAFGRLQYEDVAPEERASIEAALKRYCELDTLAMVMIVEAWREWVAEGV